MKMKRCFSLIFIVVFISCTNKDVKRKEPAPKEAILDNRSDFSPKTDRTRSTHDTDTTYEKTTNDKNVVGSRSLKGSWKHDCQNSPYSLVLDDSSGYYSVASNQILIDLKVKSIDYHRYNIYLDKPLDLGSGGQRLEWKSFIKDSVIASIDIDPLGVAEFLWKGFYNGKTKKREFLESEINWETGNNPVFLSKCE